VVIDGTKSTDQLGAAAEVALAVGGGAWARAAAPLVLDKHALVFGSPVARHKRASGVLSTEQTPAAEKKATAE
jgi:hypothetical protein